MIAKFLKWLGKTFGSGVNFTEEASLPDIPMEGDLRYAAKVAQVAKEKAEADRNAANAGATGKST
jgi:hypothetical protein